MKYTQSKKVRNSMNAIIGEQGDISMEIGLMALNMENLMSIKHIRIKGAQTAMMPRTSIKKKLAFG